MDNKKRVDDDTRKLALAVVYMSMFVLVLFGLVPSI